jgi:hypothetical protein
MTLFSDARRRELIEAASDEVVVGKAGPVMKPGEFDVSFDGYGGTVEVWIDEGDLSRTKKSQDPQGVTITAFLDVSSYESSEIDDDRGVQASFEKAASRALGVPVELTGRWYEARETREFEKHMRNTLVPRGRFRIAVSSKVMG